MLSLPLALLSMAVILLLVISACAYVVGLCIVFVQRRIPSEVGLPRVECFAASCLCAAKAILGDSIATLQPALTGLIVLATVLAVTKMVRNIVAATRGSAELRTLVYRWAAILVPSVISIGLLGLLNTVPDEDQRMLINVFIAVNILPGIYVLANARSLLGLQRRGV